MKTRIVKLNPFTNQYNTCSKTYKFIDTQKLITQATGVLNEMGYQDLTIETSEHNDRHVVSILLNDFNINVGGSDMVPRVMLRNSFVPGTSCLILGGFYRFVCANGIMVGTETFRERVIHRVGPKADEWIEDFPQMIAACVEHLVFKSAAQLNRATETDVSDFNVGQIINNNILKLPKKTVKAVWDVYSTFSEREEDVLDTVWGLYNIVNEQLRLTHEENEARTFDHNNNLLENILKIAA